MSEPHKQADNRARPTTDALRAFLRQGWAPVAVEAVRPAPVVPYAAARRNAVSDRFPGEHVVVPAGGLKVRSNDCDYAFRPHSAFAHLTGWRADTEPDSVLVLHPLPEGGHEALVYTRPPAGRDTDEFFADSRFGEFWVGPRPTSADLEVQFGVPVRPLDELSDTLAKDAGVTTLRVVRDADPGVTDLVDRVRGEAGSHTGEATVEADEELAAFLSVLRMVKDEEEVRQLREAVAATLLGFEAVARQLGEAVRQGRGERWVEGVFALHARHQGNGVGYDSICAAGDHANTLHWVRNCGPVRPGDLVLLDAGVEVDSLYTADITRTLPVDGVFTDAQREIYDAVYAAQQAGMAAVKPGARFSDIHAAAIRVVAERLHDWGLLPNGVSVEETLDPDTGQYHRRWMVHGTSHHLGLDVHDCARATRQEYLDAQLRPGMVLTVEPGLYFKAGDALAPRRFRGHGVRIEDDVLVTESGHENLSAALASSSAGVEAWMASLHQ